MRIVARHTGELTEEAYCLAVAITWPDGTRSTHEQDCPPFEEYQRTVAAWEECRERVVVCPPTFECYWNCVEPFDLRREWAWTRVFGPGRYDLVVEFTGPNQKRYLRTATFEVAGSE